MTFGQLKGQVQAAMAEQALSNENLHHLFPDLVGHWVQQAIYRLDADLLWTVGRSTTHSVVGTRRYTLDATVLRVQHVTYDDAELKPLTAPEEIAAHEASSTNGTPTHYSWYGQELALYPTPDTVDIHIEVWSIQTPTAMASDASVPTLPAHTHALLVDYALYQAFRHFGNVDGAQACLTMYLGAMERESTNYLNSRGVAAARRDSRVI